MIPNMTVPDENMYQIHHLPEQVTQVKKDLIKSFVHSKRVGSYLLGRTLGVGSFAKVKEGMHLTTGEKVAIKVIDKKRAKTDNYVRKNLRREGKLLQMIRHPNVVSLYEVMETDNSYYLVTELCRGGDLMEYISSKKRLPEQEVAKFIRQILSAVDYLHRLGIIHRDLKIENLLLDSNKDIKLIDFGLSNFIKVANSPEGVRAQEFCVTQCGSPAYAAPELLNHEKYGLQVDLWSIGVNMFAMLTGGLPFTVEPFNIKILYAKMRDRQMNPIPDDLSRDCRDLLKKFLNPDPTRRVTISEAMCHPWLSPSNKPIPRSPCPNKMKTSDLEADILSHMSENLGFRMGEVIKFVTCNIPSPACATYHLYLTRLNRHRVEQKVSSAGNNVAGAQMKDEHRILLHMQDMNHKAQVKDTNRQPSNPELESHSLTLQSRGLTSVATDATDITIDANNSKKDSGIVTDASHTDSLDRKENQNPLTRYDSIDLKTGALLADSPTHSDVSRSSNKELGPSSYSMENFQKHQANDFKVKAPTGVSVIASRLMKQMDVGRDLIDKLTQKSKAVEINFFKGEKLQLSKNDNTMRESLPPSPRMAPHLGRHDETSEGPSNKQQTSIYTKFKIHIKSKDKSKEDKFGDENLVVNSPASGRRYIPNNKLLARRALARTDDMNTVNKFQETGHIYAINNEAYKHVGKPSPVISRAAPKQFVTFRSAQDRPRLSELHPLHELKDYQKAKTSESMTLHGKNLLNINYNGESNTTSKRSVSPPSKTVIVRRKLAKRHRLGELTPPGSHVIQDSDTDMSTNLFITDILDMKYRSNGVSDSRRSPLPSISPIHTHR
nr:serine/threonine-protein kinase MARK2-like isoform X1 [Biomphalaria glabrata]